MIRIGVLGTSNIAERRMIPAIKKSDCFEYVCVAVSTAFETGDNFSQEEFESIEQRKIEKAKCFVDKFGGEYVVGYEALLQRADIDAVYIPLPPALHFKWAMLALNYGKNILVEKPFTTTLNDTKTLISKAREKELAVIENYGFCYHTQMQKIKEAIDANEIGALRLVRAQFGFPHRDNNDFRYSKKMGGGALLDCGGYTLKAASLFLGNQIRITDSVSVVTEGHDVDVFGTASLRDENDLTAQVSYGMDNYYRCELEIWGSTGMINASRAFTAPDGFSAPVIIKYGTETKELSFEDDQFLRVLDRFGSCIGNSISREKAYEEIIRQSVLVDACKLGNSLK